MTQDSKNWTTHTMKQFILAQNNYSYDGEACITHSAESLMSFAYIEGTQAPIFLKVYNKLYPK